MFSQFGSIRDSIEIIESILTVVALIVGGIWTYRLFWLRRQRYPKVNFGYEIMHRYLTVDKVLLYIIINVENTGEVLVRIYEGTLWVLQVLPLPTKIMDWVFEGKDLRVELQNLITDNGASLWQTEIPWPVVAEQESRWPRGYLQIEPGNTTQIRYELILNRDIETVKIFGFFRNSARRPIVITGSSFLTKPWFRRRNTRPAGWTLATFYDFPQRDVETIVMKDVHGGLS